MLRWPVLAVAFGCAVACSSDQFAVSGGGGSGGVSGTPSGGAAGQSVTGGSAGASGGSAGASGGTAGAGNTVGGDASTPEPCNWGGEPCPAGQYCDAQGCGAGTCAPIAIETHNKNPVCGCDGYTYWNPSVAASHGMALSDPSGVCSGTEAKKCSALQNCSNGAKCDFELNGIAGCALGGVTGLCWILPKQCPNPANPKTRGCGDQSCLEECELIKSETKFYPDPTCP